MGKTPTAPSFPAPPFEPLKLITAGYRMAIGMAIAFSATARDKGPAWCHGRWNLELLCRLLPPS
jgi:hypothetical protein